MIEEDKMYPNGNIFEEKLERPEEQKREQS